MASAREAEPYAADQAKLPPLPAEIKERKRLNIAVKCDSPPFGYIGARSQQAGFDVEIARWFSRFAFGKSNRVTYTCVTTPAASRRSRPGAWTWSSRRSPTTPTGTHASTSRAPTTRRTGRLLVPNTRRSARSPNLAGKTVVTTSGSIYDRWMKNCFKDTKVLVTDSFTNAVIALP